MFLPLLTLSSLGTGQVQRPSPLIDRQKLTQLVIQATVTVTFEGTGPSISPLIYGVNNEHDPTRLKQLGATVNRLGGTPWSTLNGPLNAVNVGNDYFFHNFNSIANVPVNPIGFYQKTTSVGGTAMLTVPLLDKVAKDTQSYAFSVRKYGAQEQVLQGDAGNGVKPGGNAWQGPYVTGNAVTDAYMPNSPALQESWLRSLPAGVPLFGLDNEPMLWHVSHRAAHPEGTRMQEVIAATKAYATKVRTVFPNAGLLGPEEWNYEGCFISGYDAKRAASVGYNPSRYPDRQANGGQDWIPVYVKALKDHHAQTGQRLLNFLSVHFYPHTTEGKTLLEETGDSAALQALRLRSTRSLWDPSYVSEDYIKDFGSPNSTIRLVPRLKEWAALFPGTKTALTEYSFGPETLMASALAEVEALGIFGREGLDLACCWPSPDPNSHLGHAFRLFRNYDGQGGHFGEYSQKASVTGIAKESVSAYAAVLGDRKTLTLIVVNKADTPTYTGVKVAASLTVAKRGLAVPVALYQLTNGGLVRLPDQKSSITGTLNLNLPPQSATLCVLSL